MTGRKIGYVSGLSLAGATRSQVFSFAPSDVLLLTVFPPVPSGCGSVLLVPAEGFDLLHAVCGRTHRGKCVWDTSPEFPYIELPTTFPTTQGYVQLLCMEQV